MNTKYRKAIIAGNWKMNMLVSDIKPFIEELKPLLPKTKTCETVLCVPAVNVLPLCLGVLLVCLLFYLFIDPITQPNRERQQVVVLPVPTPSGCIP